MQILLFAQNAAKIKMNAPKAATFLQVIRTRWGTAGHLTFMFFGLSTNLIVSSMLITGGSATVASLTGMSTVAACFLTPLGVAFYIYFGGMRAYVFMPFIAARSFPLTRSLGKRTLLCDYIHTTILFSIIILFMTVVFGNGEMIGSPAKMYELLKEAAIRTPGKIDVSLLRYASKSTNPAKITNS